MKLNLNTILTILGAGAVLAPDLTGLAAWLAGLGVPWLSTLAKVLGLAAVFFASAARVMPKMRPFLSRLGLATKVDQTGIVVADEQWREFPRDPQKGGITGAILFALGVALAIFGVFTVLMFSTPARAETGQQFGGCFDGGKVCLGPSATISVGQFNMSTSKFQGGVIPGVGYGLTYAPDQWYATGLSLYASFLVGQGTANTLTPSMMVSFANYVRLGAGLAIAEQPSGPTTRQWILLFGLGSDFGGSPSYVKTEVLKAVSAQ